jgi:hypothetical protein
MVLLVAIASAIAVAGWFMAQPTKAGLFKVAAAPDTGRRRTVMGSVAGSAMGAGIGFVFLLSTVLIHLGSTDHIAFIAAFTLVGCVIFAFTIRLRLPDIRKSKLVLFALAYALIACSLCGLAYRNAGSGFGLLALSASTGWFHATWFTAASIVGDRFGSARAAVIATTLEGAVGFTAFLVFRLLQG